MRTYSSQKEFEAEIRDGVFRSEESIDIRSFNLSVQAHLEVEGDIWARSIKAGNIKAWDITAEYINAWDIDALTIIACDIHAGEIDATEINAHEIHAVSINAGDIDAWDITVGDIKAANIEAFDIKARDITAFDIKARNIEACNIKAANVSYYAVAFAYNSMKVKSIKGELKNSKHFVLDGELEVEEFDLHDEAVRRLASQTNVGSGATDTALREVCAALGWQGGTIHQVVEEIKRLRAGRECE